MLLAVTGNQKNNFNNGIKLVTTYQLRFIVKVLCKCCKIITIYNMLPQSIEELSCWPYPCITHLWHGTIPSYVQAVYEYKTLINIVIICLFVYCFFYNDQFADQLRTTDLTE